MTRVFDTILGNVSDERFAAEMHDLGHADKVEYLIIKPDEIARRRFRLVTDKGTDCAIALERDQQLTDGSVLDCSPDLAIVVRLSERRWLSLDASDKAAALELGYLCGNLHWKVRFSAGLIYVALDGHRQAYLDRLSAMIGDGKVRLVNDGG